MASNTYAPTTGTDAPPFPGAAAPVRAVRRGRFLGFCGAMVAAGCAIALLNVSQGTNALGLSETLDVLFTRLLDADDRTAFIVRELRLPRIALAALTGAMFAVAGVIMQDTLRNPLAGPDLLGISAGSALAVGIVALFPVGVAPAWRPFIALAAGFVVGGFILATIRVSDNPVRVLLIGAALTALLNALLTGIIAIAPNGQTVAYIYRYLTGSVSGTLWSEVRFVLPWAFVGLPLALLCGRMLNLFQLGDELAAGLGGDPARTRLVLFALAGVLIAPGIAFAGPINFVALLGPHLARRGIGTSDARLVLPGAALAGAVVVLGADALGRLLFQPLELPAGVWTVVLGGPFLLLLRQALGRTGKGA